VRGSGGRGVPRSAREAVTGKRVLCVCGHLITSPMDKKQPTYLLVYSIESVVCVHHYFESSFQNA
jgi:hypothetical protein